jgi:hypothetical protein
MRETSIHGRIGKINRAANVVHTNRYSEAGKKCRKRGRGFLLNPSVAPPIKPTWLLRGISPLIFYRADVAQVRMPSSPIVEDLDALKQKEKGTYTLNFLENYKGVGPVNHSPGCPAV